MGRHLFLLAIVLCIVAVSSCKNRNADGQKDLPGKALYRDLCQPCHGRQGGLGIAGASDLRNSLISLDSVMTVIEKGRGDMQGFVGELKAEERLEIAEYVLYLRKINNP